MRHSMEWYEWMSRTEVRPHGIAWGCWAGVTGHVRSGGANSTMVWPISGGVAMVGATVADSYRCGTLGGCGYAEAVRIWPGRMFGSIIQR